ncbi:MAG: endonuclease/exonuclease/phosphatase family protein [Leptospiraceae bacterium]
MTGFKKRSGQTRKGSFQGSVLAIILALLLLAALRIPGMASADFMGSTLDWAITIANSFAGWPLLLLSLLCFLVLFSFSVYPRSGLISKTWLLLPLVLISHSLVSLIGPPLAGISVRSEILDARLKSSESGIIRILHANLYLYNSRKHLREVLGLIQKYEPDVIIFHELDSHHHEYFRSQLIGYTHRINTNHPFFGYGIYSRLPLGEVSEISTRIETLATVSLSHPDPFADCQDSELFSLVTVHPVAPFNPRILKVHRRALENLRNTIESMSGNRILVTGDFNSVDWSGDVQALQKATGLRQVFNENWLFRGTYSAHWPAVFRLPIDGIWISDSVQVSAMKSVVIPGSDHLGILVDIQFPSLAKCDSLKNRHRSMP